MPNCMHLPFYFSTRNWRKRRSNPLCSAPTLLGSSGVCSHPMLLQPETRVLGSSFCSMVQDRWPGWWSTPHLSILLGKRGAGVPGYEWRELGCGKARWQGVAAAQHQNCPWQEHPAQVSSHPAKLSSVLSQLSPTSSSWSLPTCKTRGHHHVLSIASLSNH